MLCTSACGRDSEEIETLLTYKSDSCQASNSAYGSCLIGVVWFSILKKIINFGLGTVRRERVNVLYFRQLMVAQYDYNPEKQSPLENIDSELPFKKGQVITVIGEMVSSKHNDTI